METQLAQVFTLTGVAVFALMSYLHVIHTRKGWGREKCKVDVFSRRRGVDGRAFLNTVIANCHPTVQIWNSCTSFPGVCQCLVVQTPMDNTVQILNSCTGWPDVCQCLVVQTPMDNTVQMFNSCNGRLDVCQCLVVQTYMDSMAQNKPSTSMTQVACESKLHSILMTPMSTCLENWVATERAVVFYD